MRTVFPQERFLLIAPCLLAEITCAKRSNAESRAACSYGNIPPGAKLRRWLEMNAARSIAGTRMFLQEHMLGTIQTIYLFGVVDSASGVTSLVPRAGCSMRTDSESIRVVFRQFTTAPKRSCRNTCPAMVSRKSRNGRSVPAGTLWKSLRRSVGFSGGFVINSHFIPIGQGPIAIGTVESALPTMYYSTYY